MPGNSTNDALAEMCRLEYPRLVGLLALRVGDQRVAEELAQETLVRLCQRWPKVDRPQAWLTRVALNIANSWLRRQFAERRAYRRHGAVPDREAPQETADILSVRAAVAALPNRERTVLILRYYEQLSVAETAAMMRCPEGTVKSLMHRALKRLQSDRALVAREATDHA